MAKQKKDPGGKLRKRKGANGGTPPGFKLPPPQLKPFLDTLDEKHVYITHIDNHPAAFKRKIFSVPVLMNIAIIGIFAWRIWYIGIYYLKMLTSVLGYPNELTLDVQQMTWKELVVETLLRTGTIFTDFFLSVFLWPWPVDFALKAENGNPLMWRYNVGFRDREIIVRRSRKWDEGITDFVSDLNSRGFLIGNVGIATAPMLINEKTGYLLINADWDLDWIAMCDATIMVDDKMATLDDFDTVSLVYHDEYGWLAIEVEKAETVNADEREKQKNLFAFREALRNLGKEDLFYRWIEIVQFESSQPGGFDAEKQVVAAKKIRETFHEHGIDFDDLWKEAVGTEAEIGL